jgi:carboxypeptidase C (cathepsin A)
MPNDNKISIWTESYGGHYGPTFANYFETQNDLISNGKLSAAVPLRLDTLGIINGCVDILTQMPAYPQMAFNNTYGLKIINETEFQMATKSFPQCQNLTLTCRSAISAEDTQGLGNSDAANTACDDAFKFCFGTMWNAYNNYKVNLILSLFSSYLTEETERRIRHHQPAAGWIPAKVCCWIFEFEGRPSCPRSSVEFYWNVDSCQSRSE